MSSQAAIIRPLESGDIDAVAALQQRVISWSFTGKLGQAHIRKLYMRLYDAGLIFGFVCIIEGKLSGFSVGTLDYATTRRLVSRLYFARLPQILWHACHSPSVLLSIFESRFVVPREYRKVPGTAEWLSLVTDIEDEAKYPVAALLLMRRTLLHFRDHGFSAVNGQAYAQVGDRARREKLYRLVNGTVTRRLAVNDIYVFRT